MLIIENLHIAYERKKVIENLNLSLEKGKIHGLVGLNGSGKTTFFNGFFGLLPLESGKLTFEQQPLQRQQVAFLETHNFFYSRITGREYLQLFRLRNPRFEIDRWNEIFHLPLDQITETYSTGMKKKLAFLGILCLDKPVLLLDEPFNGLDMESNQQMKLIINALREKGKTVIITSHIMESLTSICDTISFLNNRHIEFTVGREGFADVEARIFSLGNQTQQLINDLL